MHADLAIPWLESLHPGDALPIWVISYSRAGEAPLLNLAQETFPDPSLVNVVVRRSQERDYRRAYPHLTVHGMPDSRLQGCGVTRWETAMYALSFGHERVIMMDDDVTRLDMKLVGVVGRGANAGRACSVSTDKPTADRLGQAMLVAASTAAHHAWSSGSTVMLGGLGKRHMSFSEDRHRTMYVCNGGATPRQVTFWHLARMQDAGVFDRETWWKHRFGITGEDLGWAAEVLWCGGDLFNIPSIVYDHWPEKINIEKSTIRSADTKAAQHAHDYAAIQDYPQWISDSFRWSRQPDGAPEWGDVDWRRLAKVRGHRTHRVEWDEGQILDQLLG